MQTLLQALIFGLATGAVIAPSAVGLTLSYGVTGFINFSYGGILTVAAYATFGLVKTGVPLVAAVLAALIVGGAVMWIVARVCFEPLRGRGSLPLLITSIGVAFIIQNIIAMTAGGKPRAFPTALSDSWHLGGVYVPRLEVGILITACAAMLAVHLLLRHTLLGRTMRAVASNDALARLSGLDTRRIIGSTWFVSGAVAALGGVLLGTSQRSITPTMGFSFLLMIFSATLLGGIGKPYGAMIGAFVIGLGVNFGATYVSADYSYAIAFGALVVVLLVRPQGLFGNPSLAKGDTA